MRALSCLIAWCIGCGMLEIFASEFGWIFPWRFDFLLATLVVIGRHFSFYLGWCSILCIGLLREGWGGMPIGFYILHAQGVWIWSRMMGEGLSVWIVGWVSGIIWLTLSWVISGFLLVHDHPITFPLSTWISYPFQCALTCGFLSFFVVRLFKDSIYQERSLSKI